MMFIPDKVVYNRQVNTANANSRFNSKSANSNRRAVLINYRVPNADGEMQAMNWMRNE